jgi:pyridoxine 5-phosphate synthase
VRSFTANLDAAALLRDASGGEEPRLAHLAVAAELGGAEAVRLTATEALMPVHDSDLYDMRRVAHFFELCIAPTPSLLKLALEVRPARVVLADETQPGSMGSSGLSPAAIRERVVPALRALTEAVIPVCVRVPPDLDAMKALHGAGAAAVEISTIEIMEGPEREWPRGFSELGDAARLAAKLRVPVSAGGLLDARSSARLLNSVPSLQGVCSGRRLVAAAQLVGMERAVREFRAAINGS